MDQSVDLRAIVVARARSLQGQAQYTRLARIESAPAVVNCLTLAVWSYRGIGLNLPGTLALIDLGEEGQLTSLQGGDLIFTSGWQVYLDHPIYGGIGHVGIATDTGTIIHATRRLRQGRTGGVYEDTLEDFIGQGSFRVVRRLLTQPNQPRLVTTDLALSAP